MIIFCYSSNSSEKKIVLKMEEIVEEEAHIFKPNISEFANFKAYIKKLESFDVHSHVGFCWRQFFAQGTNDFFHILSVGNLHVERYIVWSLKLLLAARANSRFCSIQRKKHMIWYDFFYRKQSGSLRTWCLKTHSQGTITQFWSLTQMHARFWSMTIIFINIYVHFHYK